MSLVEIKGIQKPNGDRYLSKSCLIIWMQDEIIELNKLMDEVVSKKDYKAADKVEAVRAHAETQLEFLKGM